MEERISTIVFQKKDIKDKIDSAFVEYIKHY